LLSCHALLAGIAKTPELQIDATEAKLLAQGIVDVAKFYPVAVDPKMLAWINLTMIAGTIYGTRVFALAATKPAKEERADGPTIVNFGIGKSN
jgi:hypothetical protein